MSRIRFASFALVTALAAGAAVAGPLDPPAGPVTSTYKTLTEVEPRIAINAVNTPGDFAAVYRITQPGSYYLTGNIYGPADKLTTIRIESSNVTIDLNGFTIQGITGSLLGISNGGGQTVRGTVIKNGTVRGFPNAGIDLAYTHTATNSTLERLEVAFCGTGINCGSNALVRDCNTHDNNGNGLNLANGGIVTNCFAHNNTGNGIVGNVVSIYDCVVSTSGLDGIALSGSSTVKGTTVIGTGPTHRGILAGHANISGCTIRNAGTGISILSGLVTQCAIESCQNHGILTTGSGSKIINNSINGAGLSTAEGAAIRIGGIDCVVEGNNCSVSDRGIQVAASGNLIIRNTCSGNTINYVIPAGNRYAQIIDLTAQTGAAVSGNSAASNIMSGSASDPNANYAY